MYVFVLLSKTSYFAFRVNMLSVHAFLGNQTQDLDVIGPVHTETRFCEYAQIFYRIGVSSTRIRRFRKVKPLFFETGSQSG